MDPLLQMSSSPRRTTSSWINLPIHYVSGYFEGQTIRAELSEIQKADLGRKYARVDRRPLDPPPVVQLKLFQVFNHGTEAEYEKEVANYSEIQTLGLLCSVDLFPVPSVGRDESAQTHAHEQAQSHVPSHQPLQMSRAPLYDPHPHDDHPQPNLGAVQLPPLTVPHRPVPARASRVPLRPAIPVHFGDHSITEDMKCTTALSGATFVQPAIIDYQGKKLVFAFADLAVKIEGQFFLRYRCFDIFSHTSGHNDLPIQSECYGGSFRVYSTKEFPGLQPSTELTKQLARWGVRLNTRETERKRKRKDSENTAATGSRFTKRGSRGSDSEYE
ncbi:hypothetical protein HYDPIDRAFT_155743 [Hydnomerulius pinastri MD-312]|uniref:Velvet domain-containing protein n=1 Tax=Hydnomerulius pinastri MD-312 TaxID=994086 RepID=A0A0C9WE42_9AGAM|nr:hypothetical protein HYDPIDRAFT_155743 [Hydnomerulius pinastri MD-312]